MTNSTMKQSSLNSTSAAATNATETRIHDNSSPRINITAAQAAAAVPATPRWQPQPHWSIAPRKEDGDTVSLTSPECFAGLVDFFQQSSYDHTMELSLVVEASSHPAGLDAVYGQPWVYAGGGLGNMDECPLQVCLAGGTGRDSLTFASVCMIPQCDASDLLADDFVERLQTAAFRVSSQSGETESLVQEYITLHRRIAQVGKFLNTGWVCGEYKVDWQVVQSVLWFGFFFLCLFLSLWGTFMIPFRRRRRTTQHTIAEYNKISDDKLEDSDTDMNTLDTTLVSSRPSSCWEESDDEERRNDNSMVTEISAPSSPPSQSQFWSAWDMGQHLRRLIKHRPETACLDGLKVGSLLWIISAHVMAIVSSTAAGYLNPKDFLPPHGITTTFLGQLLFSSRYAVDTFLCISGYLAVYVLQRKLKRNNTSFWQILGVLAMRLIRILPLYMFCLGFWMYIAPHLGAGPFWYQWENFLAPCYGNWWTNILFVNNFLPWGVSTTANCFYHSWYLAVDVQLFFLFSPWLVLFFQRSPLWARRFTMTLWLSSVVVTAILSYTNDWSVNTFDGASVALFDVEGYAKPHVRAQSYLAGILVAMWPIRQRRNQGNFLCNDALLMGLALSCLFTLSFVTVTGAYERRACTFEELPAYDDCGSLWSPTATFLYTGFSRALWSVCIAIIMAICLERKDKEKVEENGDNASSSNKEFREHPENAVKFMLSWNVWTPLAHLSFGAYLIHPIVIFIWKLGGREKNTFRLISFLMDFCSITVVTYILSFVAALLVEFPFGSLLHPQSPLLMSVVKKRSTTRHENQEMSALLESSTSLAKKYGTS